MDSISGILVAIITTLGTVAVAWIGVKRYQTKQDPEDEPGALHDQITVANEKVSLWEARYASVVEELARERAMHGETRDRAEFAERSGDECRRQLNALYIELAKRGQVQDRRSRPRQGGDRPGV